MREGVEEVGFSQALVLHPHPLNMQIRGDKLESFLTLLCALSKVETCKERRRQFRRLEDSNLNTSRALTQK